MKKYISTLLPFTLLIVLLNCKTTYAQPLTICASYGGLIQESSDKFAKLKGESLPAGKENARYTSKFMLKDATMCYVDSDNYRSTWRAEYGEFNTQAEALEKIKLLQAELKACLPTIEFVEHQALFSWLPYYYFKESVQGGFYFHKGMLGINKNDAKKFVPTLSVPENAAPALYYLLTNEPDTTTFGKELNRMVTESKDYFKNITGDKIEGGFMTNYYKTTFCITGGYCQIEENLVGKTCSILVANGLSETEADNGVTNLANMVASALGKKFVWLKNEKEATMNFTEISDVSTYDRSGVVIKKEKTSDKYAVLLQVNGPHL